MSRYMVISCAMCGRDLYRPLTIQELREGRHIHFPGFYLSQNKSGKEEEYCEKCYEEMLKEKDFVDYFHRIRKSCSNCKYADFSANSDPCASCIRTHNAITGREDHFNGKSEDKKWN